jgi:hypothetical protein
VNKNICHFFLRVLFRKINSQKKLHKIRNPIHSIDYINAIKVVVRPWCGRHNSYGIFLLPINYNPERLILFNTIEAGKASRCWHKNIASQTEIAGLSIQSGYYTSHGHNLRFSAKGNNLAKSQKKEQNED